VIGERDGQAVVGSDEQLEPITIGLMPGAEFYGIWGEDGAAAVPSNGAEPAAPAWFPPTNGYRHEVIVIPPDGATPTVDPDAGVEEMRTKLPGLADVMDPDHPGMHTTDTALINLILDAEIHLRLDDGTEVHLARGDAAVVTGELHAWSNRSGAPCTLSTTSIGARRT